MEVALATVPCQPSAELRLTRGLRIWSVVMIPEADESGRQRFAGEPASVDESITFQRLSPILPYGLLHASGCAHIFDVNGSRAEYEHVSTEWLVACSSSNWKTISEQEIVFCLPTDPDQPGIQCCSIFYI